MLSQLINTTKHDNVRIDALRLDGGTQPRHGINAAYVDELAESIVEGATLPPVEVIYDGANYWLYDGFHRVAAHQAAGILIVNANIHQGTQADAQWRSYAANQTHGLRRTNEDKQRAIKAALRHPNGVTMANREIARHLGVDHKTVGDWREKLEATGEIPQSTTRTGADGRAIDTTNIGTNPAPIPQPTAREYSAALEPIEPRTIGRMADIYVRHLLEQMNADTALDHVTSIGAVREIERLLSVQASIARLVATHASDLITGILNIDVAASEAPAAPARPSVYSTLHTPPVPGWDDDDEAEYQALLPTWQQPASQFNAIIELDRITRRRVAERMSLERLDNLRRSLQERRRELWHEERRQERSASAISNPQSPISNPDPVVDANAAAATVQVIEYEVPDKPSYDVRRLTADEACTALLGQAIVDAYTVAGAIRLTLDNNQLITISSPSGGIMYTIEEA